jgi:Met-zincin/Domain of unknown function (DUF5117)
MLETNMRSLLATQLLAVVSLAPSLALAQSDARPPAPRPDAPIPTIAAKTTGMKHTDGFLPLDWDAKSGKIYLEVPHLDADLILTHQLPHGTGSNDLGLDRGQVEPLNGGAAPSRIVRFVRSGPKVLLLAPNEQFRSSSTDPAEQASVRESFAESVLWGFTVQAEDPSGAVLLDATDFVLHDVHGVADVLTQSQQGAYKVDATRSAVVPDSSKAFPKNTVIEAMLTFTTDAPPHGRYVRDVTPDPHALTVHERVGFIQLPEPGFTPRRYDPRSGYFPATYRDYDAPLSDNLNQHFIIRHRLIKKDPACRERCEAVAPIQYYVDRGAPEPLRTALVEGARWWDQAFQAAGWAPGTFRVDPLPADADPMDLRYNIIQWVHRYTRGWSYGSAISDPRTGEILKGNVTLGSLRGRQDYLIATALLAPYKDGKRPDPAHDPMLNMVLQRIRTLAAHETGHTLGLAHNYAVSTYSTFHGSVMEYPHPWVTLDKNGVPDLSHAYPTEIGDWDKVAIDYGYRQFAPSTTPEAEHAALNKILTDSQKRGIPYITDQDSRPFSSAHPHAHLWDNGADAATELDRVLTVRAAALKRFGPDAIPAGEPMADLEDTLVPLYLFHRYQTEAAIKVIGGLNYEYNLRGDGQPDPTIVSTAEQKHALDSVLKTLSPETLTLPESLLAILPPRPPGYPRTQESFPSETGLTFDPVATAESAADLTLSVLLDPARASRIVQYHMRVTDSPSLRVILEALSKTTAERPEGGHTMSSEVERAVESRALEAMMALALNPQASTQARAIARSHLVTLADGWAKEAPPTDSAEAIHRQGMLARLDQFLHDPEKFTPTKPLEAPPGMPIGDEEDM